MKTEKNILTAFILNLAFSIFEFAGGMITGSIAVLSDAIHDVGDAASIGISYCLERKSKRRPDEKYTYGYGRYSVLGGAITTLILLIGSAAVIYNAVHRIINPVEIHYNGMLIVAVIGLCVNGGAAFITREGESINQKAVNLHMLEDVLGWAVVLAGSIVMRFTGWTVIDPIMSIAVALFILVNAAKHLKKVIDLFLEKTPQGIDVEEMGKQLSQIEGVKDVHHIHVWNMDGQHNYATMHVVTNADGHSIKESIREKLREMSIVHATLELETENEHCHARCCHAEHAGGCGHHHHHHH